MLEQPLTSVSSASSWYSDSAVHRALVVEELLDRIIDWAVEAHGISSVATLARVCSLFFEPSVRRIWRVLPGVECVLSVVADPLLHCGWAVQQDSLFIYPHTFDLETKTWTPINLQRARFYLRFVREICLKDLGELGRFDTLQRTCFLLKYIHSAAGGGPAFPLAHTLTFKHLTLYRLHQCGSCVFEDLAALCGPELTRIRLPFIDVEPKLAMSAPSLEERAIQELTTSPAAIRATLHMTAFRAIAKRQKTLTHLTFALDDGQTRRDGADVSSEGDGSGPSISHMFSFLPGCTALRSLTLSIPLSASLMCDLGGLPLLQELFLTIGQSTADGSLGLSRAGGSTHDRATATEIAARNTRPFPALERLHIHLVVSWASERSIGEAVVPLFEGAQCYPQKELVLTVGSRSLATPKDIPALLELLLHPVHSVGLTTFRLTAEMAREDEPVHLDLRDFDALLTCPRLRTFEVDGLSLLLQVTDDGLLQLGRSCSQLEEVKLGTPVAISGGGSLYIPKESVSPGSVITFANTCSLLRELQLLVDPDCHWLLSSLEFDVPLPWLLTFLSSRKERIQAFQCH